MEQDGAGDHFQPARESKVQFDLVSDRCVYQILAADNQEVLVEISGYALNVGINMQHINTVQDVEAACEGISQLFREIITEKLLEEKQTNLP